MIPHTQEVEIFFFINLEAFSGIARTKNREDKLRATLC